MRTRSFGPALLVALSSTTAVADDASRRDQVGLQVGGSAGIAFPFIGFARDVTGAASFTGDVDMGYGATAHATYFLTGWLAAGLNLGYFHFPGKAVETPAGTIASPAINLIPTTVMIGVFPNFGGGDRQLRPQFGFDLGAYTIVTDGSEVDAKTKLGGAIVIGSGYALSSKVKLFGNTKFHVIPDAEADFGFIGYLDVNFGVMVTL